MPNVMIDKSVVNSSKITRNVKLSSLIGNRIGKNMFDVLSMKYCSTRVNSPWKITYCNCKMIKDITTYDKFQVSYQLINNLILDSYCYGRRLKQMIKEASYRKILFHIKGNIEEPVLYLMLMVYIH
jgi:hypothetical protein